MCGFSADQAVGRRWGLSLPKRVSSANLRTVNAGASRWRYAKERGEWCLLIRAAAAFDRSVLEATGKRRVTITRRYSGRCREMDRDNLLGGVKMLVDALVQEGALHDDKPAWLELHVLQQRAPVDVTHVLVEELA
jgi:hypothetical protein